MSLNSSELYEFGEFRLDARQKALWHAGQLVPLTPKLVETLLVLVEGDGQIVEKQVLMERVWPDTFVEEGNVTRHVSLLRKALAEWPGGTQLIETLPRRGYRFVAPLRQLPVLPSPCPVPTEPAATEQDLILETHTITRITAEETLEEDDPAELARPVLPALPPVIAPVLARARWQRFWPLGAIVGLALVGLLGWFWFGAGRGLALTEKDTLLLAEFVNRTGDPVFDGTLRQGMAAQLEQSPFLNFLSDQRVRETLKLMTRSPDERLTPEIGREICLRQGLKALIRGEIAPLGSHYVVTLEAIAGQTGNTLARAQSEADAKEQVLHALSLAANELRGELGESLSSLQKFDAMLENTTPSLPALQNLSIAMDLNRQSKALEALPFVQRAVELDPNFANAWATLAVYQANNKRFQEAAASATRAYALRDRATELERFRIDVWYHQFATLDLETAVEVLKLFCRTYPRYGVAPNTLSRIYMLLGQFELAKAASQDALRTNPTSRIYQENLAETLLFTGELTESKTLLNTLGQAGALTTRGREFLYLIANLETDDDAQQREIEALKGQPDEYRTWGWRTQRAAYLGQAQQTQALVRKQVGLAARPQLRGETASMLTRAALNLAILCADGTGRPTCDIRDLTRQALALERNTFTSARSLLALALNGRETEAQALAFELQHQQPQDTLLNAAWLPLLRAVQALRRNQPAQALEHLQATERYEATAYFLPQYLRGLAWLQLKDGTAAAAEFEKIRAHRHFDPTSPLYPLAHLGLARAAALQADSNKSRQMFQEFFKLWKDADAELPSLKAARLEADAMR